MDNEKLKKQMRDMCIAADGLATAMHLFYANVSSDILDDIIAQAERENIHHCGQDAACDERHGVYFKGKDITSCIGTPDGNTTYDMSNPEHVRKFNEDMERMYPVQDPNESQPADPVPESIRDLTGMQIVGAYPPGWKCQGCAFDKDYFRCEKKVELVGGYMICLAPIPIVTE